MTTNSLKGNIPMTQANTPQTRIFKTGATTIIEDETMRGLSVEAVRDILRLTYPEVANATVRERQEGDTLVVEFLPRPGRKG